MSNHEIVIAFKIREILERQNRISTEDFYELIKEELNPKVTLGEFRLVSSPFFNKSTEYEAARGPKGGLRKRIKRNYDDLLNKNPYSTDITKEYSEGNTETSTDTSENVSDDEDEVTTVGTCVMLNSFLRIYNTDSRNWAIQKMNHLNKDGVEVWLSKWYCSSLPEALKFVSRKLLNSELQGSRSMVRELSDLAELVVQSEKRVLKKLQDVSAVA